MEWIIKTEHSLRIQPPLIRLPLLLATKNEDRVSHGVAGANVRRLYSQAKPDPLRDEALVYTRYLANMYFAQKPSNDFVVQCRYATWQVRK